MLLQEVSDIQGFVNTLKSDVKVQMTSNINFLIINLLSKQKELDTYSFLDKFSTLLNPESEKKLTKDISILLNTYTSNNFSIPILKEKEESSYETIPLVEKMKSKASNLMNTINKNETTTVTTNNNINAYEGNFDFVSIAEGLKYIEADITEKTKDDLTNFKFDPKIYAVLKSFYESESLYDLYKNNFTSIPLNSFIHDKIFSLEQNKYLHFQLKEDYPKDKIFKLKLGELLLSLNLVSKSKLEMALESQKEDEIEDKQSVNMNANILYGLAEIEMVSKKPKAKRFIGEILIEMNFVTKEKLDQVIKIQKWYNGLFK